MSTVSTQVKLNPISVTASGVTTSAAVNFPGFQRVFDFTSAGGEASVSAPVASNTDKEYKIWIRNLNTTNAINMTFNADTGNNYGSQYLLNNAGTITAARAALAFMFTCGLLGEADCSLITPTGFNPTGFQNESRYTSGTTMAVVELYGKTWNSATQITAMVFTPASSTMTAGTRITIWSRRSNV